MKECEHWGVVIAEQQIEQDHGGITKPALYVSLRAPSSPDITKPWYTCYYHIKGDCGIDKTMQATGGMNEIDAIMYALKLIYIDLSCYNSTHFDNSLDLSNYKYFFKNVEQLD